MVGENNYISSIQDNRCVRSYAGLGVPLLSSVPLEERTTYCCQIEKILPPGPMTLTTRALSGLPVDDLLTVSSLEDIVSCLRSMSDKIQNEINVLRCSHPPTDDDKNNICVNVSQLILPVQQFLDALTDHQLMQNHALVLRYAFALNKEATQRRLKKWMRHWHAWLLIG